MRDFNDRPRKINAPRFVQSGVNPTTLSLVPTAWRATKKSIFVIIVISNNDSLEKDDPTIWALRFASKHRVGEFPAASG
jgi:hypothetical protein